VLDVSFTRPRAGAYLAQHRKHSSSDTLMAVAVADTVDGLGVAVGAFGGGFGEHGVRCPSVERALASGADPETAAAAARDDVTAQDDSLAPAWYRMRVLPVLITRALRSMKEKA
jgi:CO/xanthine dehydrogenase FAD-binding subunit